MIEQLNDLASDGCRPDLTLLLDMPAAAGLHRAIQRNSHQNLAAEARFEMETETFHDRVRQGYLELASRQSERFRIIDARGDVEVVARRIAQTVEDFFTARGCS
jgi:dTMP kinase